MFDIASTELLIVAMVALVIIGPKDLPKVMRTVGEWMGRARGMAKHFRTGMDAMIREAELEEMEKKWKADNERIMREHPDPASPESDWGTAPPPEAPRDADAAPEAAPPSPRRAPPAPAGRASPPRRSGPAAAPPPRGTP